MNRPDAPTIAIVGGTGAVGREALALLASRETPCRDLRLLASARSAGSKIEFRGEPLLVEELTESSFRGIDLAIFSAGGTISRRFAPLAVEAGVTVIDNSSAFRMETGVPLIVPEINGDVLTDWPGRGIIANPNCSTIIALMAVTPLHRRVGIERMVVSTYQSASGAGAAAMAELEQQAREFVEGKPFTTNIIDRPYLFNVFSHNSPVGEDGSNEEERKLVRETHKIWNDDSPRITATCVRVPVLRAHCESINLTFREKLTETEARAILAEAPGLRIVDDRANNRFPEPIHATGVDEILIGRIRADSSQPEGRGLNLFVAGDQLRKGAALNAIQIAEFIASRGLTAQPAAS
ncbi:MAG: aspartate-semialdehyde dehydrogenase [Phycisphaerales bacterium]|nr:MAG: aspartate-semialdehyde dehydrogenase [Phycisphaerales bacterium]